MNKSTTAPKAGNPRFGDQKSIAEASVIISLDDLAAYISGRLAIARNTIFLAAQKDE